MRQIVRNNRQFVQMAMLEARLATLSCGVASARAWHGKTEWFSWALKNAVGFLLPIGDALEASCEAGVINRIKPGELLVINRGEHDSFRLQLNGGQTGTANTQVNTQANTRAVMGHLYFKNAVDTFASTPSRAMTVVKLSDREGARIGALSRLVADELNGCDEAPLALLAHLQKALFEALAQVLCTCDPLGIAQFAVAVDQRLGAALRAMTEDPGRQWRVETLAREAALSRTLFATRFKLVLGMTPLEYLTQLRVQLAATLKAESPHRTLHDIAQAVGYADESALRRAHRRVTGERTRTTMLAD